MTDAPGYVTPYDVATAPSSGCAISPDVMPWHHRTGDGTGAPRAADSPFVLGQNYPNPHTGETTVPFTLPTPADVHLDLFDQLGRKMAGVVRKGRSAGAQNIKLNLEGLGLPAGDYIYRLQVSNRFGIFQQAKQMTLV
ncbi:T9SS type A sorting domain-containing protein [Hymenobacter ruber]